MQAQHKRNREFSEQSVVYIAWIRKHSFPDLHIGDPEFRTRADVAVVTSDHSVRKSGDAASSTMPLDAGDIQNIAAALKDLGLPAQPQQGVQAVSVKLPDFWTDKPEVWFARVEAQFNTKGINQDKTKFDYVVAALDNATAGEVEAVLLSPPDNDRYEKLKSSLLSAFGKTQAQKDAELLALTGLGDMKPTALLRRLRSLNSDAATLFRAHFLALLPAEVRSVLASREIADLDELAKTADRVMEAKGLDSHVAPVAVQAVRSTTTDSRRPPRRQGGGDGEDSKGNAHVCYYHIRFGKEARRCQPWCLLQGQFGLPSPATTSGNVGAGRR